MDCRPPPLPPSKIFPISCSVSKETLARCGRLARCRAVSSEQSRMPIIVNLINPGRISESSKSRNLIAGIYLAMEISDSPIFTEPVMFTFSLTLDFDPDSFLGGIESVLPSLGRSSQR